MVFLELRFQFQDLVQIIGMYGVHTDDWVLSFSSHTATLVQQPSKVGEYKYEEGDGSKLTDKIIASDHPASEWSK